MPSDEKPATHTWAERRHERFGLLARGEEKLRELVQSGQVSDPATLARQGWSKLLGAVRSTTPASLADQLREALGERPQRPRPTAGPSEPVAASSAGVERHAAGAPEHDGDADALRRLRAVELGSPVVAREGDAACGTVREIHFGPTPTLTIDVKDGGEFAVSAHAIGAVRDGKVILDVDRLDAALRSAIANARATDQPGE